MVNFKILEEYYFADKFFKSRIFYVESGSDKKNVKIFYYPLNWQYSQCLADIEKRMVKYYE